MSLLGVGLDDRALLGRQRAGLQQDRVGDRHLADVVQRRGVAQPLAEVRVHADVFGQQDGEASDALDVRAGVLVAELDRHRQALDRLGLRDLELGQGSFELAGAGLDFGFERSHPALPEAPADGEGAESEADGAAGRGRVRPAQREAGDRCESDC